MDDAARTWNPWWETGEVPAALRGQRRRLTTAIVDRIAMPHVLVLAGARRAGKSTILYQLIEELLSREVAAHDILFLNLEDPAFTDVGLDELIDVRPSGPPGPRRYVFLDEVQTRPGWERWILPRYERKEPVKFIVSGSTSDLADGPHAGLLTGRTLQWVVRPLDFPEFAAFHGPHEDRRGPSAGPPPEDVHRTLLRDHYLAEGGFPEVQRTDPSARRALLQQYFEQVLGRDVARQQGLDVAIARRLGVYVAETFARPHTHRALARATGIGSHDTLQKYLAGLRRSFLIETATRAATSPKPAVAQRSPFKLYWTDVGLRNALVRNPRTDRGRQAENVVAMTIAARHGRLEYWQDSKTQAEVDFVHRRPDGILDAYQVWYDPDADAASLDEVPSREWRGFKAFGEEVPRARRGSMTLLTARAEGQAERVRAVPLASWLQDAGTTADETA